MKLSIVNYGTQLNSQPNKIEMKEDDGILAHARQVIEELNMGKGALLVSEVAHTGIVNLNNREYQKKNMDLSVQSFHNPHFTPFLMHHNDGSGGMFSEGSPNLVSVGTNVLGRYFSRRIETTLGIGSGLIKVATFIREKARVGESNAIDLVQSRQLMTLSIGSRIEEKDYVCSICGKSLYDEECDHRAGRIYEGEKCYAKVFNPFFREYSAVYNPSDILATIRRMDVMESEGGKIEESAVDSNSGLSFNVYEIGRKPAGVGFSPKSGDENKANEQAEGKEEKEGTEGKKGTETHEDHHEGETSMTEEEIKKLQEKLATLEKTTAEQSEAITTLHELIKTLNDLVKEKSEFIAVLEDSIAELTPKESDEGIDGDESEETSDPEGSDHTEKGTEGEPEGADENAEGIEDKEGKKEKGEDEGETHEEGMDAQDEEGGSSDEGASASESEGEGQGEDHSSGQRTLIDSDTMASAMFRKKLRRESNQKAESPFRFRMN